MPKEVKLTSIDGTGFDSWQRSRHYEKRAEEIAPLPHMPYAKTGIFIDVKTLRILDFDMVIGFEHGVKAAERIFSRNTFKNVRGLGDKGYDSEPLHKIARANGITFYAPVRKMSKLSSKKRPKGKHRRECLNPPEFKVMRSINETVNSVLKRTQIVSLRSKDDPRRLIEFGWHVVLYNIKRKIKLSTSGNHQSFIFFICPDFVLSGQSLI